MPTSPVTEPEIEAVFGDGDAAAFNSAVSSAVSGGPAPTLLAEWRRLGAFLKRPTLEVSGQDRGAFTVLWRIYALDMAVMALLVTLASAAIAAGIYLPKTALAEAEFTPAIVLAVIIGAPVLEEIGFRSWLSGRLGHILPLALAGAGAAGFALSHVENPLLGAGLLVGGFAAGLGALIMFRKHPPMRWFAVLFPVLFWFSTLAFALVHLANFDEGSLGILLPLVLPQLVLGGLLGYVRVRIGLWAAILLHAAHNATALGIAALAMGMG